MNFMVFMSNLKTREIELKAREEIEPQKKMNVVFKTSMSKKSYKSEMKATWDVSEIESYEEIDTTNIENHL